MIYCDFYCQAAISSTSRSYRYLRFTAFQIVPQQESMY